MASSGSCRGDRLRPLRRDHAEGGGLSRRAAAHAQGGLAGVPAAATASGPARLVTVVDLQVRGELAQALCRPCGNSAQHLRSSVFFHANHGKWPSLESRCSYLAFFGKFFFLPLKSASSHTVSMGKARQELVWGHRCQGSSSVAAFLRV